MVIGQPGDAGRGLVMDVPGGPRHLDREPDPTLFDAAVVRPEGQVAGQRPAISIDEEVEYPWHRLVARAFLDDVPEALDPGTPIGLGQDPVVDIDALAGLAVHHADGRIPDEPQQDGRRGPEQGHVQGRQPEGRAPQYSRGLHAGCTPPRARCAGGACRIPCRSSAAGGSCVRR